LPSTTKSGSPYASYDDLQHRWEAIEEVAKRAEPEERQKRTGARKGTGEEAKRSEGRRNAGRSGCPCRSTISPPMGQPLATTPFVIVVITEITEVVRGFVSVLAELQSFDLPPL